MTNPAASDAATKRRMRRQRRASTKPEVVVRAVLRRLGHAYRLNASTLPGSPDLSNQKRGWAIFVHGCYWHHHRGCGKATVPKRNRDWWLAKFDRNRQRDSRKVDALRARGLRVLVVWECETKNVAQLAERLEDWLVGGDTA